MAMEYSMYPQELYVPAADGRTIDAGAASTLIYLMPLSAWQSVADAFGGNFSAEEISPYEGVTQHFRNISGADRTMKADAVFPCLRSTRYSDLAFIVVSNNQYLMNPIFEVLDLATGECIGWNTITMINLNSPYFDIYSFNSKLQGLTGNSERGFMHGNIILFGDDYVLMNGNTITNADPSTYKVIHSDGSYSEVYMPYNVNVLNNVRTSFDPVFDPNNPSRIFTGIYSWLRGPDLVFHRETHDGKMYIIFGQDASSWSTSHKPHFVVSSDVMG